MKVEGQFTIVIRGSTERSRSVPVSSWSGFDYLMHRLLVGDDVAEGEFEHFGLDVSARPGLQRDPWDHGISPACAHNWIEVTTRSDHRRRWLCSSCDAELSKTR